MKAMQRLQVAPRRDAPEPIAYREMPTSEPGPGEVLLRVSACGVCRTRLDEIEGRVPPPRLPVEPGHHVVAHVAVLRPGATRLQVGDRVGVGWIWR